MLSDANAMRLNYCKCRACVTVIFVENPLSGHLVVILKSECSEKRVRWQEQNCPRLWFEGSDGLLGYRICVNSDADETLA